jgi:hypothetical protein
MLQLTIEDAIRTRDAIIPRAMAKANREHPEWSETAYKYLKWYVATHARFWSWELREAMAKDGYAQPSELRAWGGVYKRAVREGLIRRGDEVKKDPYRHATETKCWERV